MLWLWLWLWLWLVWLTLSFCRVCLCVCVCVCVCVCSLQAVPRAHRAEPLRDELFTRVLERCMRGSTYPDDVASWSTPEMDDFQKYREVLCADALEACFEELEERFVEYCGGMLAHAASGDGGWETAEVVLFATRAAALKVRVPLTPLALWVGCVRSSHTGCWLCVWLWLWL